MRVDAQTVRNDWDLPYGGRPDVLVVEDNITDTGRWSVYHELYIKFENKYYRTSYSVGATEDQDERPWQEDDYVDFVEVRQVPRTVEVWEEVKA